MSFNVQNAISLGISGVITFLSNMQGTTLTGNLLQEDGGNLLQESGFLILLE